MSLVNNMRRWNPFLYIHGGSSSSSGASNDKYVFLMLNQPVINEKMFSHLWDNSSYSVLVDGAVNHFQKIINDINVNIVKNVPDLITGDFDSAEQGALKNFQSKGTKVISTPDQDRTDFTKSLIEIKNQIKNCQKKFENVSATFVFAESSGRFDHVMANIQTLFLARKEVQLSLPLYLLSSESVTWLLEPGRHHIVVPPAACRGHCGLLPVGGPATVTTTGLRWNLESQELKFGGLVSTSNSFVDGCEEVTVETDADLLWTMDLV